MKTAQIIQQAALRTLEIEAKAVSQLKDRINEDFISCVEHIHSSEGRVVLTGIGKSAIIANKIVATLNSTGTPSLFMHAADAIHGDLGMVQKGDTIILISKSGETPEIKVLIPLIRNTGNKMGAIVGKIDSFLARSVDFILDTTVPEEACPNNLAPTTSTTAQLAMGDALAVSLLEVKGFTSDDFAKFHPGGVLGKRLYLKTDDIYPNHEAPSVAPDLPMREVLLEMSSKRLGATAVVSNGKLEGIITDGDIRRMMKDDMDVDSTKAEDIMGKSPKTIPHDSLAVDALEMMRNNNITQVIVMDGDEYKGMVHIHDLLKEGLI